MAHFVDEESQGRPLAAGSDLGRLRMVLVMVTIKDAATEFLATKRIAVTGVSRDPKGHGSNVVYQRPRQKGYEVFAVNPHAETVEGDRAYPNLKSIPGGVEAVVIGTKPEVAEATMRESAELGIHQVWMHGSMGGTSVSAAALTGVVPKQVQ